MSAENDVVSPQRHDLSEVKQLKRVVSGIQIFEKASNVKNALKTNKDDTEQLEQGEKHRDASSKEEAMEERGFDKQKDKQYLYVAAIDIGTTYSGYAYSSYSDFMKDPLKVSTPLWNNGRNLTQKTSTFILYDPEDNFHSFGCKAEKKYLELLEEDSEEEAKKWKAFYNFKMKLYEENIALEELSLEDDQGRRKPALVVFADCIRFLKDDLFKEFQKQGLNTSADDVRFIITVPAIWDDKLRGFMINAANEAGIQEEHLLLSLEPEAAAVLCKEHHVDAYYKAKCEDILNFDFGSEFVVVDLGGGTVDITTNKVLPCGSLKELKSARGGDCGGTMVDKAFFDFLKDCIGSNYDAFKRENLSDFHELRQNLEKIKRQTEESTSKFEILTITPAFAQALDPCIMQKYDKNIEIRKGTKLKMPIEFFLSMFQKPIQEILKCLDEAVTGEIKSILLVGGFANSEKVYHAISERFPNKHVYCPPAADLSVLKGAVIYGHNPDLIASRICRVWHGVITDESFFPVNLEFCKNNFYVLTQKGQPVTVDARVIHRFIVDEKCDKETLHLTIFSSAGDCLPTSNSEDLNSLVNFDLDIPPPRKAVIRIIELAVKLKGTQFQFKTRVKTRSASAVAVVKSS